MKQEKSPQDKRIKYSPVPAGQADSAPARELTADDMEKISGGTSCIPPEWEMKEDYP